MEARGWTWFGISLKYSKYQRFLRYDAKLSGRGEPTGYLGAVGRVEVGLDRGVTRAISTRGEEKVPPCPTHFVAEWA